MNDDPGPSSAARPLPPSRPDAEYDAGEHDDGRAGERNDDSQLHDGSSSQSPSRRQEKRRAGLAKKLELISHLQRSLDMMVFVYICTLYYME